MYVGLQTVYTFRMAIVCVNSHPGSEFYRDFFATKDTYCSKFNLYLIHV